MGKVMYCERCGQVYHIAFSKKCDFCKTKMKLLPEELKYKYHIFVEDWAQTSDEEELLRKENFVMNELANNPLFSVEDYKKQVQKKIQLNQKINELEEKKALERMHKNIRRMQNEADKVNCIPKCPTCGSTNVVKISLAQKAVGGAMVGLYSSDIRNTMHCKNCGAKW